MVSILLLFLEIVLQFILIHYYEGASKREAAERGRERKEIEDNYAELALCFYLDEGPRGLKSGP